MDQIYDRCSNYPLNLDASLRFTRDDFMRSSHPHPPMIGGLSGLLPLYDVPVIEALNVASGWGPMAGVIDTGIAPFLTNIELPWIPKVRT